MPEVPKRLHPLPETLRRLFLLSGNFCAYPDCDALMMNSAGVFIGQVCHIQAALPGGPRFNPDMTNESRRAASNLMLMCYQHHVVTDDADAFTVQRLTEIKSDHERRFSAPQVAMLARLTDWTSASEPTTVRNLRRMNEVLKWGFDDHDLREAVAELNAYIGTLRKIPADVRRFMGALAKRLNRMQDTAVVQDHSNLLASDFMSSHGLIASETYTLVSQMAHYGVGGPAEFHWDHGVEDGISLSLLNSGWPIWPDIVQFCEATATPLDRFVEDMDFSLLDSS